MVVKRNGRITLYWIKPTKNESISAQTFQKSWRSFSPITVCTLAQCQCQTQWGPWGSSPPPIGCDVLIFFRALYDIASIYCNGLVEVWGVLGDLGCFNVPHDGYANS